MSTKIFIDPTHIFPASGVIFTDATNNFDGSQIILMEQFNQMAIASQQEFVKIDFLQPYKLICKFVQVSGTITVTLPNSQGVKILPVPILLYGEWDTNGFILRTDSIAGAVYHFDFTYRAIGI